MAAGSEQRKAIAAAIIWRFADLLDELYGFQLDAGLGIGLWKAKVQSMIATPDDLKRRAFFGEGVPDRDEAVYNHATSLGEIISRNDVGGSNTRLLSQMLIVLIYTIWDTSIRPEIAKALSVEQKTIASDVFGDLRLYRIAILHNVGVLQKDTKALSFVPHGAVVSLPAGELVKLMMLIFEDLKRLCVNLTGIELNLDFQRRLNPPGDQPSARVARNRQSEEM